MLRLHARDWVADLAPEDGGGMTLLRHGDRDILVPAPAGARLGGPFGAFWMIPWANRLDHGVLGDHRLPVNRPVEDTAIHGLSRDRPWEVDSAAPDRAVLLQGVDAAPYAYDARMVTTLSRGGLAIGLVVTNRGREPLPFGFGWHPWFVRPEGMHLAFRATHRCTHDARCLPVSAAPTTGLDGGEEAFLGLDTHFAGWDGVATLAWPGLRLTLSGAGALATNLQVYAPRDKPVLCVEPSSHLPDAANRPDLAPLGPMKLLAPGESLTGAVMLTVESSHRP